MNSEKFSKLILELRKEKNMTQQELANILHITDKAISKWERGISLPDVCLLESISNIFDISVAELIKGERIKENSNTEINNIIVDTLKDSKRKINKKNIIIFSLGIFIIFILLVLFFINNYKNVMSYYIVGDSDNFVNSGVVTFSNQGNMIELNNFEMKDTIVDKIKTIRIKVFFDNILWGHAEYYGTETISVHEFLSNLKFAEYSFDDKYNTKRGSMYVTAIPTTINKCFGDPFECAYKLDFPNNMQINIEFCDINKECVKEKMKISATEIVITNKIF